MTRAPHGSNEPYKLFNYVISTHRNNCLNQYLRTKNDKCKRKLKVMERGKVEIRSGGTILEVC